VNKFLNINYLKTGSSRQQQAFKEIKDLGIFKKLQQYDPLLAGTIPIGIDIATSDLDIICYCEDHLEFSNLLQKTFGDQDDFQISTKINEGYKVTIANFNGVNFPIEIFGQNIPSKEQNAFRHMLIEYKILKEKDSIFIEKIITLKKTGLKTEPAFAKLLGIKGNPYKELLKYD